MQISPEKYSSSNNSQKQFALTTIDNIACNNRFYNIIIDLGSGDGGITKQLATRVPHRRVLAVDVDPAMTEYSRRHNALPSVEYVTQDMSVEWSELSANMRLLAGKVGLIFANYSLQYIPDKSRLMSICNRLLVEGGVIYVNLPGHLDLNKKLPPIKRREWCPSAEQSVELWRRAFTDNGLAIDSFDSETKQSHWNRQHIIDFWPTVIENLRKHFETDQEFESEKNDLYEISFDTVFNAGAVRADPMAWTNFLANEGVADVPFTERVLHFVCHKI